MTESQFGFSSPDPLDLINSTLSVQHSCAASEPSSENALASDDSTAVGAPAYEKALLGGGDSGAGAGYEQAEVLGAFEGFKMHRPMGDLLADITAHVGPCDLSILAAFLSRADGSVDLTPNRLTQVIFFWRRIALILLSVALDPPGSEFPSAQDCIAQHVVEKSGQKRLGHSSVACLSPFECVSRVVEWTITIRSLPLSHLQVSSYYPTLTPGGRRHNLYPHCSCRLWRC